MADIKSIISLVCVVLIVAAFVIMVFSWFGTMINAIKILRNIKPDTRFFRDLLGNHFHAIVKPEFLTDEGLLARKRLFKSAGALILPSFNGHRVK